MTNRSRLWLCTLNNPEGEPEEVLELLHKKLGADYTVGQLEKGANDTPHLQFAVHLTKVARMSKFKKVNKGIHAEVARSDDNVYAYVQKEDTRVAGPWEFGVKPVIRSSKTDWEEVKAKAIAGKVDEIPADIYVKHYRNL